MIYRFISVIFVSFFTALFLSENSFAFSWKINSEIQQRPYLYLVGSSTVSPFMASISEEFSREQNLKNISTETPVVESSGTREGFKLFCHGVGLEYPDFINASRVIEKSEIDNCHNHGVKGVVEIKIGYDGIVFGNFAGRKKIEFTKEQIFLALAEKIYDSKNQKLIKNPYSKWNEIDPNLPAMDILVYGPPLTSGTRDVFVDMVMEDVCFGEKEFIEAYPDEFLRKKQCQKIRSDGKFVESGENDNLIIKHLESDHHAFGIFGFNFLVANRDVVQAAKIDGVEPNFSSISSKKYKLSRPLFIYFKKEHLDLMPQMRDFTKEIISTQTLGRKGYLLNNGLIALSDSELAKIRKNILAEIK